MAEPSLGHDVRCSTACADAPRPDGELFA
jgi:hypothetical protein